ncbi:MAG TPA: glycosyltransferase [Candidatus Paceibacterota bacterium]|jgi:hypothetical protein|nr:glycosyltransferase [Candidatus Paceibacterota bacterium]
MTEKTEHSKPSYSDLVIYMATLYEIGDPTSDVRSKLALATLRNASRLGIKCVVADGRSSEAFLKEIEQLNPRLVEVIRVKTEWGEQRRDALNQALADSSKKNFLFTDPEKDQLITEGNIRAMLEKLAEGADIVVASRVSKESYPDFQRDIETKGNLKVKELLEQRTGLRIAGEFDVWFGPKMFNRRGAEYFKNYRKAPGREDMWDSIIAPVADAAIDGLKIETAKIEYRVDESQRNHEMTVPYRKIFITKRERQFKVVMDAVINSTWKSRREGQDVPRELRRR